MMGMIVRISILMAFFAWGFFAGCSAFPRGPVDSALDPYVDSFLEDMDFSQEVMTGFSIGFRSAADKKSAVIGTCNRYTKQINIDPSFFYSVFQSEKSRTALVYHELTHCICYSDHTDTKMEDDCPTTIMNSKLASNSCLQKHWNHYKKELAKRCE